MVSNDQYRDLFDDGDVRSTIEERILQYTFVNGTSLMFPQDPLGKNGPNLDAFLAF